MKVFDFYAMTLYNSLNSLENIVVINGETLVEFDSERCQDCPLLTLCDAGQFVTGVSEVYEEEGNLMLEYMNGIPITIELDDIDEDSSPDILRDVAKQLTSLRKIRPAEVSKFMKEVVEAQGKLRSDFIKPDGVSTALEKAMDTNADFLETAKLDVEIADLDRVGEAAVSFASEGVCRAINPQDDF